MTEYAIWRDGERIAVGSREACEGAARLLGATVPAVVRQCQAGDVVRATFTSGLIVKGRKYRISSMRDPSRASFRGYEPTSCSLDGFDYVPPTADPGLPVGYSADAMPPGWEPVEFKPAKHGTGYISSLGRPGCVLYEQQSCGWTWCGSQWVCEDSTPVHEAMRIALGLDWIGELWTNPCAIDTP